MDVLCTADKRRKYDSTQSPKKSQSRTKCDSSDDDEDSDYDSYSDFDGDGDGESNYSIWILSTIKKKSFNTLSRYSRIKIYLDQIKILL